jgi:hypothetical protein
MLPPRNRPFRDFDMTEPTSFMNCRLHRCPANTGEGRDLVDRQVAHAMVFYLAGNDAKDRALPFRVALPQSVRQCARSARHPATVSRCFSVGRPLALPRHEPVDACVHFGDRGELARRGAPAQRPAPFYARSEIRRFIVIDGADTTVPK